MKQRNAQYEFIRTVSMLLVIGVHTLANLQAETAGEIWCSRVLATVFFLCNGLFFMLSGRFALAAVCQTWEDYKNYYLKKLVGLGVPILVYMLVRTFYDFGWNFPVRTLTKQYIRNVVGGYFQIDYWFLYNLAGYLVMAPLLGGFFQRAGKKELLLVLLLGVASSACETHIPGWSWSGPLAGMLYFILGYGLERLVTTPREERMVYIIGALSFAAAIFQKWLGYMPGVHGGAPLYVCMLSAAYLGMKRLYRPGRIQDRIFIWIGRYSFGVYMLHSMILNKLAKRLPIPGYLPKVAVVMLLTAAVSLAIGFLLDNGIVRPIQRLVMKFCKMGPRPDCKK